MTISDLLDRLELTLAQAEDGPPEGLHPRGNFVGSPPRTVTGIIVVAPDGGRFYLGAWTEAEAPDGKAG